MAAVRRTGTTLKLNLALSGLPRFSCLPADAPQPVRLDHPPAARLGIAAGRAAPVDSPMAALRAMWADVQAGRLPDEPTIEWYVHTTVDPSLRDAAGHHSSALFVQSVPYELAGTTWDEAMPGYVDKLLAICDRYAPGTSDLVADADAADPAGDRGALRHHRRPHPPRRQHGRLRPTGCRTPPASTACTPAAPAATRPAA